MKARLGSSKKYLKFICSLMVFLLASEAKAEVSCESSYVRTIYVDGNYDRDLCQLSVQLRASERQSLERLLVRFTEAVHIFDQVSPIPFSMLQPNGTVIYLRSAGRTPYAAFAKYDDNSRKGFELELPTGDEIGVYLPILVHEMGHLLSSLTALAKYTESSHEVDEFFSDLLVAEAESKSLFPSELSSPFWRYFYQTGRTKNTDFNQNLSKFSSTEVALNLIKGVDTTFTGAPAWLTDLINVAIENTKSALFKQELKKDEYLLTAQQWFDKINKDENSADAVEFDAHQWEMPWIYYLKSKLPQIRVKDFLTAAARQTSTKISCKVTDDVRKPQYINLDFYSISKLFTEVLAINTGDEKLFLKTKGFLQSLLFADHQSLVYFESPFSKRAYELDLKNGKIDCNREVEFQNLSNEFHW